MDKYLPKVSKTIKTVTKKNWLQTIEGKVSETCFSLDWVLQVGITSIFSPFEAFQLKKKHFFKKVM